MADGVGTGVVVVVVAPCGDDNGDVGNDGGVADCNNIISLFNNLLEGVLWRG